MYLQKIVLRNYRNYESQTVTFAEKINLFQGANAQGKTNLLEAIYYLAIGKSYRLKQEEQLIRWGQTYFLLESETKRNNGQVKIEVLYLEREEARRLGRVRKVIKINGLKIKRMSDFLGHLTAVLFSPENLNIIKGGPGARRKLLDNDLSQVSPGYYLQLQKFNQIVRQRNFLLKKMRHGKRGAEELAIWNMQLKEVSQKIIEKRLAVLEKLTPLTRLMQRKLTGGRENLEFKYLFNRQKELKKDTDLAAMIAAEMERVKTKELERGMTLWGPHLDDFLITLNGANLKLYGSQGQHRTAVLAIKLAELEFFKSESGEYPLLLLDDVFSELDQERREYLLGIIQSEAIQCFITATDNIRTLFPQEHCLCSFVVQNGVVQPTMLD